MAFQVELATMATPGRSAFRVPAPSTMKASLTPGMARIASRLARSALPPNTGHLAYTAYSMPGTCTSMPNSGLPLTMAALSTPPMRLPSSLKLAGSFSTTWPAAGTVSFAAAPARAP